MGVPAAAQNTPLRVAVVIPAYKSRHLIADVLLAVPDVCETIYVVDDACPDGTGAHGASCVDDPRIRLISLETNQGVGGATLAGFSAAFDAGHDIAVKIDSDGQHDPALVSKFVSSMAETGAGYCKGSRFTTPKNLAGMPRHRMLLNAILSITNKVASGYYSLSDPTNGLIAVSREAFNSVEVDRIARRFFFESDLMCHLNLARVAASQVPMRAAYGSEQSNLSFSRNVFGFIFGTIKNTFRRIFLRHFVLSFSLAGIFLTIGVLFSGFALVYGVTAWVRGAQAGVPSGGGTIAIVTLSALIGVNFISTFFVFDVNDEPQLSHRAP